MATVGGAAAASGPSTFACSAVDARRAVAPRECMSTSILMSHRPIMHLDRHAILWASWISVVGKSKYIPRRTVSSFGMGPSYSQHTLEE